MTERDLPKQLRINWYNPSDPIEESPKLPKQPDSPPVAEVLLKTVVLPWNFTKTFPPPLNSAMEAGVFAKDVPLAKQVADRHDHYALRFFSLLTRIERIRQSMESAHTERREWLATVEVDLWKQLDRNFAAYEKLFGSEARQAFRDALNAQRLYREVIANPEPTTVEIRYEEPKDPFHGRPWRCPE
jgi:hypothetical protein